MSVITTVTDENSSAHGAANDAAVTKQRKATLYFIFFVFVLFLHQTVLVQVLLAI